MNFGFIKDVSMKHDRLIAGLDIGSTKVCAVVGELSSGRTSDEEDFALTVNSVSATLEVPLFKKLNNGGINIIGLGVAPSTGMKRGDVSSIEHTVESIKKAVREAEIMAGVEIKAVHLSITGRHVDFLSSHGVIAVKDREIGQKEVDSVIEAAKAVAIPFDREMLHVIPVGFSVNGQNEITDPRGMAGVRLETNVRIITGASTSVQNLVKSCRKVGIEVIDVVFQPLASADAVLTDDEKNLGVAIVDIGGGTTDIAVFHEGNICHSAVLAIGGNNFTNDLAIGLRIPTLEAEDIKTKYGCSMLSMIREDEYIENRRNGGKLSSRIPRRYIVEILQPRAEELLGLVKDEITENGFHKNLNSGVVLTGGAVLMEGMDAMAENILELPVRIGNPAVSRGIKDDISNPAYASAVGLVIYGAKEIIETVELNNGSMITGMKTRMKDWFGSAFGLF